MRVQPWVRKNPWSRKWEPTPVFLPGKSHRQRNLAATIHAVAESAVTEWACIAALQASLSFSIARSLLKLTSIESVTPSSPLILCLPFLLSPSIFPIIRVFSVIRLFPNHEELEIFTDHHNGYHFPMTFHFQWPGGAPGNKMSQEWACLQCPWYFCDFANNFI